MRPAARMSSHSTSTIGGTGTLTGTHITVTGFGAYYRGGAGEVMTQTPVKPARGFQHLHGSPRGDNGVSAASGTTAKKLPRWACCFGGSVFVDSDDLSESDLSDHLQESPRVRDLFASAAHENRLTRACGEPLLASKASPSLVSENGMDVVVGARASSLTSPRNLSGMSAFLEPVSVCIPGLQATASVGYAASESPSLSFVEVPNLQDTTTTVYDSSPNCQQRKRTRWTLARPAPLLVGRCRSEGDVSPRRSFGDVPAPDADETRGDTENRGHWLGTGPLFEGALAGHWASVWAQSTGHSRPSCALQGLASARIVRWHETSSSGPTAVKELLYRPPWPWVVSPSPFRTPIAMRGERPPHLLPGTPSSAQTSPMVVGVAAAQGCSKSLGHLGFTPSRRHWQTQARGATPSTDNDSIPLSVGETLQGAGAREANRRTSHDFSRSLSVPIASCARGHGPGLRLELPRSPLRLSTLRPTSSTDFESSLRFAWEQANERSRERETGGRGG